MEASLTAKLEFRSRRSPVLGRRGMAATSQPLAVAAGLEILDLGGNAADAAVAMAAALSVTEPGSTGLGGDCFALYYQVENRRIYALNGSGRAPASLSLDRLRKEGFRSALPPFHPYTVTVPGACAGWCDLSSRHGRLDLADTLAPAVRLAEQGFPVGPVTAYHWNAEIQKLRQAPGGFELTIEGRAPRPGEIFRNPGLACTLEQIAQGGKAAFYEGDIGAAVAAAVRAAGGCLAEEDLAAHYSTWERPISTSYHGLRIWECPPNGQGLAALLALNIAEGLDLADLAALSTQRLHLEIEAMRLAFAAASWAVADPAFHALPLAEMLSKSYAETLRKEIDPQQARLDQLHRISAGPSDTVYLTVVDEEGNACSFINSVYKEFGTGIVPSGLGFSLQNRGANFSLDPEHPNSLEPGKRPYHTIIPAMATHLEGEPYFDLQDPSQPWAQGGALFASFGVMGGFMQPQGHLQVVIAMSDDDLDPQAALDQPRFCLEGPGGAAGTAAGTIALEEGIPVEVVAGLAERGHTVRPVSSHGRSVFGRGQIIRIGNNGVLWGGSDPRADGCAMCR